MKILIGFLVLSFILLSISLIPYRKPVKTFTSENGKYVVEIYDGRSLSISSFYTSIVFGEIENSKIKKEKLILEGEIRPAAINVIWSSANEIKIFVPPGKVEFRIEKVDGFNIIFI